MKKRNIAGKIMLFTALCLTLTAVFAISASAFGRDMMPRTGDAPSATNPGGSADNPDGTIIDPEVTSPADSSGETSNTDANGTDKVTDS